jgi:hypothetical protein
MKCIIVIKGVTKDEYEGIRSDLWSQFQKSTIGIPFFAWLPAEYPEIEIVWFDASKK